MASLLFKFLACPFSVRRGIFPLLLAGLCLSGSTSFKPAPVRADPPAPVSAASSPTLAFRDDFNSFSFDAAGTGVGTWDGRWFGWNVNALSGNSDKYFKM